MPISGSTSRQQQLPNTGHFAGCVMMVGGGTLMTISAAWIADLVASIADDNAIVAIACENRDVPRSLPDDLLRSA